MTVAKAKEEWNNFMSRWNYMSMGYIKFFFKNHMEKLISAMGLTARKNHYTHARGKFRKSASLSRSIGGKFGGKNR